jgi:hypothetical protein
MPYVLQHRQTGEIFACHQVNHYKLGYYGVKYWEWEDEVTSNFVEFLKTHGVSETDLWVPLEMDEQKIKIGNVKLKNHPANQLYLENEIFVVRKNV